MNDMGIQPVYNLDSNRNDDGFAGGWFWIVLIFLFAGGNWFGNRGDQQGQNNFIENEFIKRDIFSTNQNVSNSSCQNQRDILENRYTNQLGLQTLGSQMYSCCCETQKEIIQSRYDNALQAKDLQAQLYDCCCQLKTIMHTEAEATRNMMAQQELSRVRDELNSARDVISNESQSRYILSQLGRYGVYAPVWQCNPCGYGCGNL